MKWKRMLWGLAGLAAVAACLAYAARSGRTTDPDGLPQLMGLAPGDAVVLAYADLSALRRSPLVARMESMAHPVRVDPDYARFMNATGFDYRRDLDRVVVAERPDGASYDTVVFAEGRFDRGKITAYALRSGKLETENGRAVYIMPSKIRGNHISLAFLSANRLALSDGGDLGALLAEGGGSRLGPAMRARLSQVDGSPLFAAVNTSVLAGKAHGGTEAAGNQLALFRSVKWLNLAAQPEGDYVHLFAEGDCGSAADAQSVAGTLELVRTLLRGGLANPKARGRMSAQEAAAASRLLQAVHITRVAAQVRIQLDVTPQMLPAPQPATSSPAPPVR